jgi:hypothetical protein
LLESLKIIGRVRPLLVIHRFQALLLHPTAGDPGADPAAAKRLPAAREVIALVGVQLGRAPAWPAGSSSRPDNRRDRIDQPFQELRVVGVGRR